MIWIPFSSGWAPYQTTNEVIPAKVMIGIPFSSGWAPYQTTNEVIPAKVMIWDPFFIWLGALPNNKRGNTCKGNDLGSLFHLVGRPTKRWDPFSSGWAPYQTTNEVIPAKVMIWIPVSSGWAPYQTTNEVIPAKVMIWDPFFIWLGALPNNKRGNTCKGNDLGSTEVIPFSSGWAPYQTTNEVIPAKVMIWDPWFSSGWAPYQTTNEVIPAKVMIWDPFFIWLGALPNNKRGNTCKGNDLDPFFIWLGALPNNKRGNTCKGNDLGSLFHLVGRPTKQQTR